MTNRHNEISCYQVSQRSLEILSCFNTFSSNTLVEDAKYTLSLFGSSFVPGPFTKQDLFFGVGYANDNLNNPNRSIFRFLLNDRGDINLFYDNPGRFEKPRTPISVSTLLTNRYREVFSISDLQMAIYEGEKFLESVEYFQNRPNPSLIA